MIGPPQAAPPVRSLPRWARREPDDLLGQDETSRADEPSGPGKVRSGGSRGPAGLSEPDGAGETGQLRLQPELPPPELTMRERGRLALRERLPLWVQLRCGLEPRALAALVLVLVVAAGFAVQQFWAGRPEPVHAPELVNEGRPAPEPRPSQGPAPGAPPTDGTGAPIFVDVSGKVRRPGVHRLPAGSRVADALRAAGGVKAGTDLTALNRARVLSDGEQVLVGVVQPPGAPAPGHGPTGPGATAPGPVSLNSATVEQLETLPGVGPVLAQHIVDYRTENGGFRSVDELREVNGIGDRRFADLRSLVRP
ncbi:ComEA family DNA-binding protein [Streptomyces sp. NPDC000410]|uniref:ComEA family DNA-binding protein n=1 Tax=Streptomyces sp. NPDC000410 TaxID=3154254 RepID=UPI003320F795